MELSLYKELDHGKVRFVVFSDDVCERIADVITEGFDRDYVSISERANVYFGGVPARLDVCFDTDMFTLDEFVKELSEKTLVLWDIVYTETKSIEF